MADFKVIMQLDAQNKRLFGCVVDDAGLLVESWGSIELVLGKDPGTVPASPGHSMGLEIKFRETAGCDEEGNPAFCITLRSEWYATALTSDPET